MNEEKVETNKEEVDQTTVESIVLPPGDVPAKASEVTKELKDELVTRIMDILGTKELAIQQRPGAGGKVDYIDKFEAKKIVDMSFNLDWSFVIESVSLVQLKPNDFIWQTIAYIDFKKPNGERETRYGVGAEPAYKKGMSPDLTCKASVSDAFKLASSYMGVAMWLYSKLERESEKAGSSASYSSGSEGTGSSSAKGSTAAEKIAAARAAKNKQNNATSSSASSNTANTSEQSSGGMSVAERIKMIRESRNKQNSEVDAVG